MMKVNRLDVTTSSDDALKEELQSLADRITRGPVSDNSIWDRSTLVREELERRGIYADVGIGFKLVFTNEKRTWGKDNPKE